MSRKTVTISINGQKTEVPQGATVIQAFKKANQEIAHYCWHPGLSVAGVCRLCLVEIKGQSKLQIACNTEARDGMEASSLSPQVKEAVRWGLEFHLINHPLDCPICDQAGECALQDQYMKFGRYRPGMGERKVKKRKAVDLGSKIVLDTERCILCSRCVRFTDEVTGTGELGIFQRGDRSEIGVFKDKPLNNNYALNTVDICPVGALTSKSFRFQQRVWYLKTADSVCTGCSTGCHIFVDYNEEGLWRVRPRPNMKINGHWICDKGRALYQNSNRKKRLLRAQKGTGSAFQSLSALEALSEIRDLLPPRPDDLALVLTGQYTLEEYLALRSFFGSEEGAGRAHQQAVRERGGAEKQDAGAEGEHKQEEKEEAALQASQAQKPGAGARLPPRAGQAQKTGGKAAGPKQISEPLQGLPAVYHWKNNESGFNDFDGLLLRGDRNPNTKGLLRVFRDIKPWADFEERVLEKGRPPAAVFVAGPENPQFFPDIEAKTKVFELCGQVIWAAPAANPFLSFKKGRFQIPVKTFFEKDGSYLNFQGEREEIRRHAQFALEALSLTEIAAALKSEKPPLPWERPQFKQNQFLEKHGKL